MNVKDFYGNEVDFDATVALMDDDLREELHNKLAPCSEQEFFTAYGEAHRERFDEDWAPYMHGQW